MKNNFWLVIGIVFILFGVILIVLKDYIDKLFKIKTKICFYFTIAIV